MRLVGQQMRALERQGVVIDDWGIDGGRLTVTLDRRSTSGSDEILRQTIGSAGLCISHGGVVSVAG